MQIFNMIVFDFSTLRSNLLCKANVTKDCLKYVFDFNTVLSRCDKEVLSVKRQIYAFVTYIFKKTVVNRLKRMGPSKDSALRNTILKGTELDLAV